MIPGDAVFPTIETAGRPRAHLPVAQQEAAEPGGDLAVAHALAVGLHRHHHEHAEQQGRQQPPAATQREAPGRGLRLRQSDRNAGDHEQQRHSPPVEHDHRPLQPLGRVHALEVEPPVGHIGHAHVVEDQQGEGENAQGIDIVAALGHGRWLVKEWLHPARGPAPAVVSGAESPVRGDQLCPPRDE